MVIESKLAERVLPRVVLIQRDDGGVKIKLLLEVDRAHEATLAGAVCHQVGANLFNTPKLLRTGTANIKSQICQWWLKI